MDTIYLLPGEERCVDFRDANGVPKVHYTYCSFRGRLFNCTCCTKDEAQRLCEDWLIKQESIFCPVRNAALIFEMPMESRRYTTLTVPSVANFSTAPAAQRTKPSGCVKIGL